VNAAISRLDEHVGSLERRAHQCAALSFDNRMQPILNHTNSRRGLQLTVYGYPEVRRNRICSGIKRSSAACLRARKPAYADPPASGDKRRLSGDGGTRASKSSGQCWSITSYCPRPVVGPQTPADRGYEGGFATAMMLKDLKLAHEAAARAGASTPLGAQAEALYALAAAQGFADRDFSAFIQPLRGRTAELAGMSHRAG